MIDTKPQVKFCSYCGTFQEREGKYCFACGSLIKFTKDGENEQITEIERKNSPDKDTMKSSVIADKIAVKKEEFALKGVNFSEKMELKKLEFAEKKEQFEKKMALKKVEFSKKMAKKKEEFKKKREQFSRKVEELFG